MPDTPYYTASALRTAVPDLVDTTDYPDADLTALIAEYESKLERYRGVAYTTRAAVSESHTLNGARAIITRWQFVRSVTSIAVVARDGTSTSLVSTDWEINGPPGIVDLGGTYTGVATIVYSHYLTSTPEADVLRGCREFVRATSLRAKSGVSRDVLRQGYEGQNPTFVVVDWANGVPTPWTTVNDIWNALTDYRRPGIA